MPLTVGDVWARVRRRPVMAAVPLALGLAAGVGYAVLAPPTYNSTASVVVQPLISDQFGGVNIANVINMATEAQVAQSSQVAGLAAKRLKVPAAQVRDGLSVAAPQGTQVIELHYSADNQQAASDGAQVVAESYLAYREGAAGADADRRLAAIQKQIDDANLKLSLNNSSQAAYQDSLRCAARRPAHPDGGQGDRRRSHHLGGVLAGHPQCAEGLGRRRRRAARRAPWRGWP